MTSPDERADRDELRPIFSRLAEQPGRSRDRLVDEEMLPATAYQIVHDAWRLRPGHTQNWTLHHLSDRLRMKGWLVPAYPLPDALADRTVQRIVVRDGLSGDLADRLLDDIATETAYLDQLDAPIPAAGGHPSFHH